MAKSTRMFYFLWVVVTSCYLTFAVDLRTFRIPHDFCYSYEDCDHNSQAWPESCKIGMSQSPINFHSVTPEMDHIFVEQPPLRFAADHFFLQNNAHTVNMALPIEAAPGGTFFPGYGLTTENQYRFSNAHFHWGKTDDEGSEHTIDSHRFSMEMHLVHYNEIYMSASEAIGSGDSDALAVIGIFFNVVSDCEPNPALAPILRGLEMITDIHGYWAKIEEPIDLDSLLPMSGDTVFHYKGSLTTPNCDEQVNWYVFQTPIPVCHSDIEPFRRILDGENRTLLENHRPVQNTNDRKILVLKVI